MALPSQSVEYKRKHGRRTGMYSIVSICWLLVSGVAGWDPKILGQLAGGRDKDWHQISTAQALVKACQGNSLELVLRKESCGGRRRSFFVLLLGQKKSQDLVELSLLSF